MSSYRGARPGRLPMTGQRGFSLLELLVAFSIMAMALGLLYRAAGGSVRTVGDTERNGYAVVLAQSLMASYDAVPEAGINIGGESAGLTWQVRSEPYATALKGPDIRPLHQLSVLVRWGSADKSRQLELATLLPQQAPIPNAPGAAWP
jgi:general secretion pathway protein I